MLLSFFLARHGETDWNAERRVQGQTADVPLNARGRDQARGIAEALRGERIGAIATSSLRRARETAEIVAAELGVAVELEDPDLSERHLGVFEGYTAAENDLRYPVEWATWLRDRRVDPPGAEPFETFRSRVAAAVRRTVTRLARPDSLPLLVSHRFVLEAFVEAAPDGRREIPNADIRRLAVERL